MCIACLLTKKNYINIERRSNNINVIFPLLKTDIFNNKIYLHYHYYDY